MNASEQLNALAAIVQRIVCANGASDRKPSSPAESAV
jgi:hypothetical protein